MSIERKALSVNELDFNRIKSNISTFLNNQSTFTDYDFESSGLSVILDILSYFTHYQGVYNNLVANELFLDSAVKRNSLVSHAKSLGYTPRSISAPVAVVNIENYEAADGSLVLRRGTRFTGRIGNTSYNFVPIKDYNLDSTGNANNVEIYQGNVRSVSYVVPTGDSSIKYTIPQSGVDTKTIVVQVYESVSNSSGISDVWAEGNNYTQIGPRTNAYFLQENFDESFSISFGDGIIGRKLEAGNVITITYLTTDGSAANGLGKADSDTSRSFVIGNSTGSPTVSVVNYASGGGERETISSIRYNAPKAYAAQNRAVTTNDFEALVANNFGGFRSVYAFGGEDAEPPQFGRVIVTLNPNVGSVIPSSLKNSIESFLRQRCSVGVTPIVEDPTPLYIKYQSNVVFNPNSSFLNVTALKEQIGNNITNFIITNTNDFNTAISISKLQRSVLNAFPSVSSMSFSPFLEFRFVPVENTTSGYVIDLKNPIFHPHDGHMPVVSSNLFGYTDATGTRQNVNLDDDGNGNLRVYQLVEGEKVYLENNFGTVNYERGVINISNYALSIAEQGGIRVTARIGASRLTSRDTSILLVDQTDSSRQQITMFPDNRPDRQLISSNSAEGSFVGTSSISRQITLEGAANVVVSESVTGTQNPSGGGVIGDASSASVSPPSEQFFQNPGSGSSGLGGGY